MAVAATTTRVYLVGHYDHQVPDKNDPCLVGSNFREVSDTPQANYRNQPGLAIYPAAS